MNSITMQVCTKVRSHGVQSIKFSCQHKNSCLQGYFENIETNRCYVHSEVVHIMVQIFSQALGLQTASLVMTDLVIGRL